MHVLRKGTRLMMHFGFVLDNGNEHFGEREALIKYFFWRKARGAESISTNGSKNTLSVIRERESWSQSSDLLEHATT